MGPYNATLTIISHVSVNKNHAPALLTSCFENVPLDETIFLKFELYAILSLLDIFSHRISVSISEKSTEKNTL